MILAHVSDFHVSTYGESFHDRRHFPRREEKPFRFDAERMQVLWEGEGWRVVSKPPARFREKAGSSLHLVDQDGYEHLAARGTAPLSRLKNQALTLHARSARVLAKALPSPAALETMLAETPWNTNLRFIKAARQLLAQNPDFILVSGDLTDNGDGYELVEALFADWIAQGRFWAVPGNHDRFLFPMRTTVRPLPSEKSKRQAWQDFASRVGMQLDPSGAWVKEIPETQTIVVGLDSCVLGQKRVILHSGAIGENQLSFLRGIARTSSWQHAKHRLVSMHHHLVPLSYGIGGKFPTEVGMRLDDAVEVARLFHQIRVDVVLHGHRHVSESRQPAGCHFHILAAPSLSIGCHSGDKPSFWRVQLEGRFDWERIYLDMPAFRGHTDLPRTG